jgi:hypothetical protein
MNSVLRIFVSVLAVGALGLSGCGPEGKAGSDHEGHAEHVENTSGVTFNAKHGLMVPPATAKFIGLEVADVEERKIATTLRFSAQVYRAAKEAQFVSLETKATVALASGALSSQDASMLHENQALTVTIDETALRGHVIHLNHALQQASGSVEVLVAIADPHDRLANGSQVAAAVPLGGEKSVLNLPRSALLRTAEGDFVYTVSGDYFVRAPIKVGTLNSEFIEVLDGLYAGDRVVVKPVMSLWMAELQSIRGGKACADGH